MGVGTKLVVLLWQLSQLAVVGKCALDLATGVTPAKPVPLWQVEQPAVMPVWFIAVPAKLVVDLWQVSHEAVVGIWLVGLAKPAPPVVWQVAQPVVMPVWFMVAPPLKLVVDLWQVSQAAVVAI